MKSHEAIKRCTGNFVDEIAKRLRLAKVTLYKWMEPTADYTDSGALNPLDRIEIMMESSLSLGNNPKDALTPLNYLGQRFKQIIIPLQPCTCESNEIMKEFIKVSRDFGHLAEEVQKSLEDGVITKQEASKIIREGWHLIGQTGTLLEKAKEFTK